MCSEDRIDLLLEFLTIITRAIQHCIPFSHERGGCHRLNLGTGRTIGLCRFSVVVIAVHVITRKSLGEMTRKLSVTESHSFAQFLGTVSRRNLKVASANSRQLA